MNTKVNKIVKKFETQIKSISVYEAEKLYNELKQEYYPKKDTKPYLKQNPTASEARKYAIALEKYESEESIRKQVKEDYVAINSGLRDVLEYKVKDSAGLFEIPEQYRDKAYKFAYNAGHSCGMSEVYVVLTELLEIFD